MIDDLLPSSKGTSPKNKRHTEILESGKEQQATVTFSHGESTQKLLHDLVWLKQFVIDMDQVSQGDLIREALELLAEKIDYKKLSEKYSKQLEKSKPKPGRKKR